MNLTSEEQEVVEQCAMTLKQAFGSLKRIIFDLGPEGQADTAHCEFHWKVKINPQGKRCGKVEEDENRRRLADIGGYARRVKPK